jgi:glutamyl-Q tRNA(Asp) synthetase
LAEVRTRFAPSPTGHLHLGHVFSALTAWELAQRAGGTFVLRIEDLDRGRSRPDYEAAIFNDLEWLGLRWERPVLRQSEHRSRYDAALDRLTALGVTYPCRCTRADIRAALAAPQERREPIGAEGGIYPGTCRGRSMAAIEAGDAVRLDLGRALAVLGDAHRVTWTETGPAQPGTHRIDPEVMRGRLGDVVLARRDIGAAYHLAVLVDDAHQRISHVVRGEDLLEATPLHRLLQALLGLPAPVWHHHRLIRDETGRRLAKRDDDRSVAAYRSAGLSAAELRRMVSER